MPPVDVYADVLFLINFGMDALCLILTARLLHRKLSMLRLTLSAAVGGVYGVIALLLEVGSTAAFVLDVAVCFLMCGIALGGFKLWLSGGIYVLTSMVMGGVMTALYHWLNRAGIAELLPAGEEGVSSVAFVLLAMAGGLFTFIWGRVFRRAESRRAARLTVNVTVGGQSLSLVGMVDSGNLMADPISGTPVIAVKKDRLLPLLSLELRSLLEAEQPQVEKLTQMPEVNRLCVIPIDTAAGSGLLIAIRPQRVCLAEMEGKKRGKSVSALIAPIPLTEGDTEALVPSGLL